MAADFIAYGVPSELADKAKRLNLTKAKVLALSQADLRQLGFSQEEVDHLKECLARQPIPPETVYFLLKNSNSACCVCKGRKGQTYVIHHIDPYAISKNNEYHNLAVLCPVCHDLAHRPSALTLGITIEQLRQHKRHWEEQVALANSHRAAAQFKITRLGVDYANVTRIEQACKDLLGEIPVTSGAEEFKQFGVQFGADRAMDLKHIAERLSNGRFLFNFGGGGSSSHWIELVEKLGSVAIFHDINAADTEGTTTLMQLGCQFAFYTGFCQGRRVQEPIQLFPDPINVTAELGHAVIDFAVDPMYFLSATAISRVKERNRYAVYFWIRSVDIEPSAPKAKVSAIPLLMAAPAGLVGLSEIPWIPTNEFERQMRDEESR